MKPFIACLKGLVLIAAGSFAFFSFSDRAVKPRILVFTKTAGYHHESIADGKLAIKKLGTQNNFDVDTTSDAGQFNEDVLKKYSAVVFLSTTGDVLNSLQEAAFERYIQAGGGYVGIHAAADCEYDWNWYGRLAGGYFLSHPGIHDTFPNIQTGVLNVVDVNNQATKHLSKEWTRRDEFYSYKKLNPDIKVLMTVDEKTFRGGENGTNHPMTWYHEYDGGRAFYTALGHTKESFADAPYLKLVLGGIQYAIGDNKDLDFAKAKTLLPPDEDRFSKAQLVSGEFYEPTEMTVLPNLDVLILQRRGEIMLYKNATKKVRQVGFFDVYSKTSVQGVNAEEGMLGLAKDPNFANNNWVYIYYSPADVSVNRLSRFTFKNDTLDKATEKVILEVKSQREICCHTGGSIAFGPDNSLFFSAGDNSTPFDEKGAAYVSKGFAPMNDLPGREQYDARRSSGNTNDLRGKIMRIKVKDDGTYEIPEGNLFPKGNDKARPEIYVMGNRNPYRISVDQKNGYLYWGEVGPDARADSFNTRGPRGYDELNQARKAGFFGWPLFVGNNIPYRAYDYGTGKSGAAFDPLQPINDSRNNTGLRELPPVSAPFIWYPYDVSTDFPQVGSGGRNAMAGPVYYTDMFPKETRLPDYYNGKLFMYDWIRGWIKVVTLQPNGDFDKMEPFFSKLKVNALIDMEVGPDGKLYLLEYGSGWFSKNADAGLARIDFNSGNRPPVISAISVNKTSGLLPLAVKATVNAKDLERDKVTYKWNLGNGMTKETTTPEVNYVYTKAGPYKISVEVKDNQGASSKSSVLDVYAGNEAPQVKIALVGGNKSFYMPGTAVKYAVSVKDNNMTKMDPANLFVSVDYTEGFDKAAASMGHQQATANLAGKSTMLSLDCKACHKEAEKSVGPSFLQVSQKYAKRSDATGYLTEKILKGSSGVWGEVAMPAHPALPQGDARQIVSWIMSLSNKDVAKKSLPPSGVIIPPGNTTTDTKGPAMNAKPAPIMVITASYTDKGGTNIKSLTGTGSTSLQSNTLSFTGGEKMKDFGTYKMGASTVLLFPSEQGWFSPGNFDLTGVRSVNLSCGWQGTPATGFELEARLDAPGGKLLGKGSLPAPQKGQQFAVMPIPLQPVVDGKFHTIYFIYKATEAFQGGVTSLQFNAK